MMIISRLLLKLNARLGVSWIKYLKVILIPCSGNYPRFLRTALSLRLVVFTLKLTVRYSCHWSLLNSNKWISYSLWIASLFLRFTDSTVMSSSPLFVKKCGTHSALNIRMLIKIKRKQRTSWIASFTSSCSSQWQLVLFSKLSDIYFKALEKMMLRLWFSCCIILACSWGSRNLRT